VSKVELALACDAVEYGEISVAMTMATQKQSSTRTFAVKASPAFVRLSLSPRSKRSLASYTVERKLEIREFALCRSQYSYQQMLMRLECHNLLFCKREYEYVVYGVRLIRMTKKLEELRVQRIRKE